MGCTWTLDDICKANFISVDTIMEFLKCFIEYDRIILHEKWVLQLTHVNNITNQENIFRVAGFYKYTGSSDATYIPILNYLDGLKTHIKYLN